MKYDKTAKRLKLALDNANMRPQELADKSGVSKASISQYINGSHAPSNLSSGKMGEVLGVNPLWLMGFDVSMDVDAATDYYFNKETAQAAQDLFENHELRALFDTARDASPEDINTARDILIALKKKDKGSDNDTGC